MFAICKGGLMTKLELAKEKRNTATRLKDVCYNEYKEWQQIERIFDGQIIELEEENNE